MKTNMKQKGFTLIELLVVIVIIGILATISVATFSGYFAKARDTERQAAVRNAATVLKTALAVGTMDTIKDSDSNATDTTEAEFATVLSSEGGFAMPAATQSRTYALVHGSTVALENEFAYVVCSEEAPATYFIDGTAAAETAVAAAHAGTAICTTTDSDVTDMAAITNYTTIDLSD